MITDIDITIRLILAAALGSIIGFERERLLWAAGIRTHMLVSVGACLLMIVSAYGFQRALEMQHVILDPSRIAAQVVSGIGFLGAGAILLKGEVVRGLTTAASIWAVAAIGLAAGGGLYYAATVSTLIILAILAGLKPLEELYRERSQSCTVDLIAEKDVVSAGDVRKMLGLRASQVRQIVVIETGERDRQKITVRLARVSEGDIQRTLAKLSEQPGIVEADVTRKDRRNATQPD
jgi:putative Mg2+ transporter-C (MgtC) family protein